mmetsp:Transcript_6197/g.9055  ORF Transcript_6197/g.9055 Transcript_6197/m.9055 type:complete len:198 (+) Transcript_6197:178-771(+)
MNHSPIIFKVSKERRAEKEIRFTVMSRNQRIASLEIPLFHSSPTSVLYPAQPKSDSFHCAAKGDAYISDEHIFDHPKNYHFDPDEITPPKWGLPSSRASSPERSATRAHLSPRSITTSSTNRHKFRSNSGAKYRNKRYPIGFASSLSASQSILNPEIAMTEEWVNFLHSVTKEGSIAKCGENGQTARLDRPDTLKFS